MLFIGNWTCLKLLKMFYLSSGGRHWFCLTGWESVGYSTIMCVTRDTSQRVNNCETACGRIFGACGVSRPSPGGFAVFWMRGKTFSTSTERPLWNNLDLDARDFPQTKTVLYCIALLSFLCDTKKRNYVSNIHHLKFH